MTFNVKLSAKQILVILTGWLALVALVFLWNPEVRDVIRARLSRKSVAQRLTAIAAAKPWIVETANQIQGDLAILVFKNERLVELHAKGWDAPRIYKMTGFNGKLGPKLREGDGQIPEGVYGVESLNPNSAFHLSLKVSYPNATDRRHAKEAGRDLSSVWRICLWSAIAVTLALAIVRRTIPAVGENLPWATLVRVPAALLLLGFAPCALCLFPQLVHLTEKGIAFQLGSGSTFLRYEEITSVSIEDRNELRTFVVRAKTKRGRELERAAVASSKIAEADIVKFLADIGYGHLYRHTPPPSA